MDVKKLTDRAGIIAGRFDIGDILQVNHVPRGLIHTTFRIHTERGDYSLQQLHPMLATEGIIDDYVRVTAHCMTHDFPAPRLIQTKENSAVFEDDDSRRWRLTTWLSGESYDSVRSPGMAQEAAEMLGSFHAVMSSFSGRFRSTHPLHDTRFHRDALVDSWKKNRHGSWPTDLSGMIDAALAGLAELVLPPSLPRRVVHGDPKISNILFDERDHAVAIIDCDTCAHHTVLVDIGDAVRSWCRAGVEDEQSPFRLDLFEACLQGYAASPMRLVDDEIRFIHRVPRLITLELTSRFLRDVLEDSYFGWDPQRYSSRREHNLARARSMLFLANGMARSEEDMAAITSEAFVRSKTS